MKKYLVLIFFLVLIKSGSIAATVFGSDIGWTKIGQDSFIITLTLIGDCRDASIPSPAFDLLCNTTSDTLFHSGFNLVSVTDVTNLCKSQCSKCTGNCSFGFGIKKYVFSRLAVISTSSNCCELKIIPSTAYRPSSINTGSGSQYLFSYAVFNRCLDTFTESPRFVSPPFVMEALYNQVIYDPKVISRHGDSLVFKLVAPLKGPGIPIFFTGNYSYKSPLFFWGFPNDTLPVPRGFHLDTGNGRLVFTAFKAEESMFSVEVNIYRQGVWVSMVRREMGYTAINSSFNNHPELTAPYSVSSCVGYPVNIRISSNDFDMNDSVDVFCYHDLDGASFLDSNQWLRHSSGRLSWTPDSVDMYSSPKVVYFQAVDNSCPVPRTTFRKCLVYIKPDTLTVPVRIHDLGCGNFAFAADTPAGISNPAFNWELDASVKKSLDTFVYYFGDPGKHSVDFVLTTDSFCSHPFYDVLIVDTSIRVTLPPDTTLCYGKSLLINAEISGNSGPATYFWSTGDSSVLSINTGNLYQQKQYTFTAYDSSCTSTDKINVSTFPNVYITYIPDLCKDEPAFNLNMFANVQGGTWYSDQTGKYEPGNIFNPRLAAAGYHWVWYYYTDTVHGCSYSDSAIFKINPVPDVKLFPIPDVCETTHQFSLDSFVNLQGGTWSSDKSGFVFQNWLRPGYVNEGVFTLYYDYYDPVSGCRDIDTTKVLVKPSPVVVVETETSETVFCADDNMIKLKGWPAGGYWQYEDSVLVLPDMFNPAACHDSFCASYPRYIFKDTNNCSTIGYLRLDVYAPPYAEPLLDSGLCFPDTLAVNAKIRFTKDYTWLPDSLSSGKIISGPDGKISYVPAFQDLQNGYLGLKLTLDPDYYSACKAKTEYYQLKINTYPVADFDAIGNPSGFEKIDTIKFMDKSRNDFGPVVFWQWDFGDQNKSNLVNPSHVYDSASKYNVSLVVISRAGCLDTLIKDSFIRVIPLSSKDIDYPEKLRIEEMGNGQYHVILQKTASKGQLNIYTLQGKIIVSEIINDSEIDINLQNFSQGFYILKINKGNYQYHSYLFNH